MKTAKRKRLEAKGWKIGSSTDFLGLSSEEAAYVELKLALSKNLQTTRKEKNLTQEELARLLKSRDRKSVVQGKSVQWCVDLGGRRIIKKIFFKQKTAYEMISGDWSSDVCSSDLKL